MYKMLSIIHFRCIQSRYITILGIKMRYNNKINEFTNPGIRKRIKALDLEDTDVADMDANAIDMESDFLNVDEMCNAHKSELQSLKEHQQLKIVQRKYFKTDKEPNLLTWEEKEQIHYLHNLDPQEWDIKKLANGFPVSEAAIKKILKAKWEPPTAKRVLKYNQSVLRNWKLLKQGKLEIPLDLKVHIEKFASRRYSVLPTPGVPEVPPHPNENIQTEFASIIHSYKSLESRESDVELKNIPSKSKIQYDIPIADTDHTYVLKSNKSEKKTNQVTLEKYREEVLDAVHSGHPCSKIDKVMLTSQNRTKVIPSEVPQLKDNGLTMDYKKKVNSLKQELAAYPEKIRIPDEKWIRGTTYKVEDCYYDDDGEFLYRVPGMKG